MLSHVCDTMESTVHGILQARILEWVAISSSRGSFQSKDWTQDSHIAGRSFKVWTTSMVILKVHVHEFNRRPINKDMIFSSSSFNGVGAQVCAWQNVIISQVWDFCWVDCDEGREGQGSWSYHKTMIITSCHGIQAGWEVKREYERNEGQWSGPESTALGGLVGFEDCWYLGTGNHQAHLSMRSLRQEYWSGLPFPPPGDLSNPRIEPMSLVSAALQVDSLLLNQID